MASRYSGGSDGKWVALCVGCRETAEPSTAKPIGVDGKGKAVVSPGARWRG